MVATIIDVAKNVDTQKQLFRVHLRLRKRLASEQRPGFTLRQMS